MAFNKNKALEAARKLVEKGQIDKAIKEYLRVVQEDPKDVRVWLKIGDLYAKKGAKAEATETYVKVAKFYSEQGFYLKAVAVYKQILKLDPRLVEINLKLAELYRQLGLLSDAMQHFEMVAAFFHREGKTREALATIRQLVDLDPENVATRIKLAELYSKESMKDEAIAEFAQVCEFLRAQNRQDDFIKVAERLLWHQSENLPLSRELATLYLRRNDPRRALQKLQACFKADQRDVETLALLAQAFQALEQKAKTVSVLKELARILTENGQMQQAREVHRKVLLFAPDDPDSKVALGEARPATGEGGGAALRDAPAAREPLPAYEAEYEAPAEYEPVAYEPVPIAAAARSGGLQPILTTGEMQAYAAEPPSARKTGSMPLVADSVRARSFARAAGLESLEPAEPISIDESSAELSLDDDSGIEMASATGEQHAEEIVKILTETDVYVKYGLQQKAIEHLRRVFDLDPGNVEAREKLKDILFGLGREAEAVRELHYLAQQAAVTDPERAAGYVREILAVDPAHPGALQLAHTHRLPMEDQVVVGEDSSSAIELSADDLAPGSIAAVEDDIDFDDIDFQDDAAASHGVEPAPTVRRPYDGDAARAMSAVGRGTGGYEMIAEPQARRGGYDMAVASPAVAGVPRRSDAQAPPGLSRAGSERNFDLDDLDGAVPTPAPGPARERSNVTVEVRSDDVEEILGDSGDDLDFDGAVAQQQRAFDEALAREEEAVGGGAQGYGDPPQGAAQALGGETEADADADAVGFDHFDPEQRGLRHAASDFVRAEDTVQAVPGGVADLDAAAFAHPGEQTLEAPYDHNDLIDQSAGTTLEDDLDEADFFVSQGLFGEARDILDGLFERYPNHPLVLAKMHEVASMEETSADSDVDNDPVAPAEAAAPPPARAHAAPAAGPPPAHEPMRRSDRELPKPAVMLQKPLDDEDADTHYDLGLAYKEMGLFEEAIKAFTKVLHVPGRAIKCHLMIGLCHRERGNLSEAIHQFKAGLYVDGISDREKYGLYYEIGGAYEEMQDPSEALYYFEMVHKKDAKYRDVAQRVEGLRGAAAPASKKAW